MSVQAAQVGESTKAKIESFSDPLNYVMGNMYEWEHQKGWQGKVIARGANFFVLGMNLTGFFFNIIKAPFIVAAQPPAMVVLAGASIMRRTFRYLTTFHTIRDKVSPEYFLDSEESTSRRKLYNTLSKVMKYTPTLVDFGQTILNVAKYAIGFFASLTIGFVSVSNNIWVHHKLGLICNPELAKEDRKNSILNHAQKVGGHSKKLSERYKKVLDKRKNIILEELKRKKIEEKLNSVLQEKRDAAKAKLEEQKGGELGKDELKQIEQQFWKPLRGIFKFDGSNKLQVENFLNKFFNWKKSDKSQEVYFPRAVQSNQQPFFQKPKQYEAYMTKYSLWNLTEKEVRAVEATISVPEAEIKVYETYLDMFDVWKLRDKETKVEAEKRVRKVLETLSISDAEEKIAEEPAKALEAEKRLAPPKSYEHYYDAKNDVLKQLQSTPRFVRPIYDLSIINDIDTKRKKTIEADYFNIIIEQIAQRLSDEPRQPLSAEDAKVREDYYKLRVNVNPKVMERIDTEFVEMMVKKIQDEEKKDKSFDEAKFVKRQWNALTTEESLSSVYIQSWLEHVEEARNRAFNFTGKPLKPANREKGKEAKYSILDSLYEINEAGKVVKRDSMQYFAMHSDPKQRIVKKVCGLVKINFAPQDNVKDSSLTFFEHRVSKNDDGTYKEKNYTNEVSTTKEFDNFRHLDIVYKLKKPWTFETHAETDTGVENHLPKITMMDENTFVEKITERKKIFEESAKMLQGADEMLQEPDERALIKWALMRYKARIYQIRYNFFKRDGDNDRFKEEDKNRIKELCSQEEFYISTGTAPMTEFVYANVKDEERRYPRDVKK